MRAESILGIDYGDKAIGVALARGEDAPIPFTTLTNDQSLLKNLKDMIDSRDIKQVVVGWPRNLEGESTHQTGKVEIFARQVEALGVPVVLQDEAVTSELALSRLPKKLSLRETKNLTHQYAAVIILEDYIANQT